jgi:mannose-1-phosphate guanylyltransferase
MFVVVMAGGSGTRFWPASRAGNPKQFLNITGSGPLLLETCERVAPLARDDQMVIITGETHVSAARKLFHGRHILLIGEPVGRNTAPCIGLGALVARHRGHNGAVAFLPADHFIQDRSAFLEALRSADKLASSGGIVTLGILPTHPETGYGYIRREGDSMKAGSGDAFRVSRFVEKPDPATARAYISSGEYYWNGGIFVATPDTILREVEHHLPKLYEGLLKLERTLDTPEFEDQLKDVYGNLEGVSFDHGVMEKSRTEIYVIPCACGWSDVGTWSSLYGVRKDDADPMGNISEGESLLVECRDTYVSNRGKRMVACLGLKNCLVVDTDDALLVADLSRSQDVRLIVNELKKRSRTELL